MSNITFSINETALKNPKNFYQLNQLLYEVCAVSTVIGKHNHTLGSDWTDAKTLEEKKIAMDRVLNDLPDKASVKKNKQTDHPGVKPWTSFISIYKPYDLDKAAGKGTGGEIARNFHAVCVARHDPTLADYNKKPTIEYPVLVKDELVKFMGLTRNITSRANITRFVNNYFATMNLKGKYEGSDDMTDTELKNEKRKNYIMLDDALIKLFKSQNGHTFKPDPKGKSKKSTTAWKFEINKNGPTFIPSVRFNNLIKVFITDKIGRTTEIDQHLEAEASKSRSISTHLKHIKLLEDKRDNMKNALDKSAKILDEDGINKELDHLDNLINERRNKLYAICKQYRFPYNDDVQVRRHKDLRNSNGSRSSPSVARDGAPKQQSRSRSPSPAHPQSARSESGSENDTPTKRSRGRPPGSKNKNKN